MFNLFSVDDHVVEHAYVWTDRVSAKHRERAPHVIFENGREQWEYEDERTLTMGLNAVAGLPPEKWSTEPSRFDDMIPGCYDPVQRADDFISQGILASVAFPTLPRFGGALFSTFKDKDLASECVRAWNDFILEEWCTSGPPGLYVPMVIVQLWDPHLAAAELTRCVEKGAKALCFVENPVPLGLPGFHSDAWSPLWEVTQETDVPVCLHIGSSGVTTVPDPANPNSAMMQLIALANVNSMSSVINVLLSDTLHDFPKLKMVWSEAGIGWVPSTLERADRQVSRHQGWAAQHDMLPSELFHRNMYCCMIDEPLGLRHRADIGIDRILWENDYPHADTPWPIVQESCEELFSGVPQDDIDIITHGNAERIFNWKMADPALIGAPLSDKARRFTAKEVQYVPSTLTGDRCGVLIEGALTQMCGLPIGEDGLCLNGHSSDQTHVSVATVA